MMAGRAGGHYVFLDGYVFESRAELRMPKKIGEVLLERGLLTPLQLDKALKTQLILGGHLGTCLIELGYVDEKEFGRTLAEIHGMRYAEPEALRNVAPQIIRIFTWKMAEKYQAIPIMLEEKTLHLAVIDPRNLGRLSTLTGYKVVPWIAPEFRVYEAMETYYDVQRRPRYIKLCNDLANPNWPAVTDEVTPTPDEVVSPEDHSAAMTSRPRRRTLTAADMGEQYGYGRSWRDVADELFEGDREEDRTRSDETSPRPRSHAVESEQEPQGTNGDVYRRLSRAESSKDLSRIVLDHFSERAATCIMFTVKSETASIWDWHGFELNPARVPSLMFPVTSGSIFAMMLGDGQYRGPVTDKPEHKWFYDALRLELPEQILLIPVYLDDRLVSIVYADGGPTGKIRGTTESYLKLAQRLGLALKMLVLKMKIVAGA
jgi:hypothetical protein